METDFLTILALIWVIYIFLFTEADRQLSELFNRLKTSISISNEGVFELTQLQVKQQLGVPEIIDLGKTIKEGHTRKANINMFHKKYREINQGKLFLIANLFLLSFNIIILTLLEFPNFGIIGFKIHTAVSLIFSFIFYLYISKIPNLKFINFRAHLPQKEISSQGSTS